VEVSVTNQAFVFLSSVIGGLIVGFLFDVFRIFRKVIKTANIITYLQDLLFWILVSLIIFTLVFITNHGELRWYEFVGVILGVIFYSMLFSAYVMRVSVTVINFIKRILLYLLRIILFPFMIIYKIIKRPMAKLRRYFCKLRGYIKRIMKRWRHKIFSTFKNVKIMLKKV